MSKYDNLQQSIKTFDSSPIFAPYSKVVITVSDTEMYSAGDDTGRTLSFENPWGTQRMADNLLLQIQSYQYQPFTANGALMSPAVELGDGITVNNVKSRVFTQSITFGTMFMSDISAPEGEEIDHEYPYFSSKDRKVQRQLSGVKSTQTTQATDIQNRVPKVGGSEDKLSWSISEAAWILKAAGQILLQASEAGGTFGGNVYAGQILHGDTYGNLSGDAISDRSVAIEKLSEALQSVLQGVTKQSVEIQKADGTTTTLNYLAWEV